MDDATLIRSAQVVVPCTDLAAMLAFLTGRLGFRVDSVMPADAPQRVIASAHGTTLCLEAIPAGDASAAPTLRLLCARGELPPDTPRELRGPGGLRVLLDDAEPPLVVPPLVPALVITRAEAGAWSDGRAGMQYRDLIPGRLGGRFVASHIRIADGGPVADYVHWHRVRLQVIFCRRGWVRVVYEDQGPPFVMQAGDCVLQPPGIRHRVLEASSGLEVIELSCPADHATLADHAHELPTGARQPEREFGGQRFVRHVAAEGTWHACGAAGFECLDSPIADATRGLAALRTVRAAQGALAAWPSAAELLFLFVLRGELALADADADADTGSAHVLRADDACVLPPSARATLRADGPAEWLEVRLPA